MFNYFLERVALLENVLQEHCNVDIHSKEEEIEGIYKNFISSYNDKKNERKYSANR
jgi:hypothetical protein